MKTDAISFKKTIRGFSLGEFIDYSGSKCSIQDSSLATEPALWLGLDAPEVRIFDPHNGGWRTVPDPPAPLDGNVLHCGRMQLTISTAIALRDALNRFIESGSCEP